MSDTPTDPKEWIETVYKDHLNYCIKTDNVPVKKNDFIYYITEGQEMLKEKRLKRKKGPLSAMMCHSDKDGNPTVPMFEIYMNEDNTFGFRAFDYEELKKSFKNDNEGTS